jgi:endonuclease/exonuclease/phosphatase family metal-dependent hydrolase
MTDNRYEKIKWRGFTFDRYTRFNIEAVERALGFVLWIVQGSYNAGGVAASAGTHDGGGAADFSVRGMTAATIAQVVKALRKQGFAAWYRPPNWDGRGGGAHIHAELIGNAQASAGAKAQWSAFRRFLNGLANNGRDLSWHPALIRSAPYKTIRLRFATWNFPGPDKLPDPAARIRAGVKMLRGTAPPVLVGWNELEGIRKAHVASTFAHDLDDALGAGWNLVKPTRFLNENYVSYQSKILRVVKQYDDSILQAPTGGRHLTRVVFQVIGTDLIFAVGQTHLVNGSTAAHERDRQAQAADALASMRAVSAKHDDCPFIIQGDMNTAHDLTALTKAGMKNTRVKADTSTTRDATTFTNYEKTAPSTNRVWVIDQQYVTPSFYVVGYAVRQGLVRGKFRQPRPSDHQLVVSSATTI